LTSVIEANAEVSSCWRYGQDVSHMVLDAITEAETDRVIWRQIYGMKLHARSKCKCAVGRWIAGHRKGHRELERMELGG